MITWILSTIIVLLLAWYIYKDDKYTRYINKLNIEIGVLGEKNKTLKYNYDNLLKVYKSSLNKMKNLQRQAKNKGK